jgi:aminoglycoside phosphotransferase (APT) family kinase protein
VDSCRARAAGAFGCQRVHPGPPTGFFDWDFAGPVTREWDLAYTAFSWVPLHARHVVALEGFNDFAARSQRLRRFLDVYGWSGDIEAFVAVMRARTRAHADGIRRLARAGDPLFVQLVEQGAADDLDRAVVELTEIRL